jgi:anion-transporting  ArsA/GET3 family ATPase
VNHTPKVIVCAGGGGVGKTTTSAALALALAAKGSRALIVTIDPARRLAGALGVSISDEVTVVPIAKAEGRLHALMPDPRQAMRTFLDYLFENEPAGKSRLLENRIYKGLADAAAGVHELVAMNLVARASRDGQFDYIVIDTAPSRHAIDFVTYPGRLAALLGGRTVAWLAGLAQRTDSPESLRSSPGILSWGTSHAESLLSRVTGPTLLRDTASLFTELATVRERFVDLTSRASELLLGDQVAYVLVAAPTAAARDDVRYLAKRLEKLGRLPQAVVLNRAESQPQLFVKTLQNAQGISLSLTEVLTQLEAESVHRAQAADDTQQALRKTLRMTHFVRLPYLDARTPDVIVMALSDILSTHLGVLGAMAR